MVGSEEIAALRERLDELRKQHQLVTGDIRRTETELERVISASAKALVAGLGTDERAALIEALGLTKVGRE